METITHIAKIAAITQFILIIISIIIIYITKLVSIHYQKKNEKIKDKIRNILLRALESKKDFLVKDITFFKNSVYDVLSVLSELEQHENITWLENQLKDNTFLPVGRKLYNANTWFKRYLAVRCFSYGYETQDRLYIQKLIKDNVSLISINAGKISVKFHDEILINTMLDVISGKRRLQQSVYTDLVLESGIDISYMLIERLKKEENIYTKIVCYKILATLPSQTELVSTVSRDMALHNSDLEISILTYIMHSQIADKNKYVFSYANNENPNVKAIVAKLLADINSNESYVILEKMLCDPNWWVRLNAATSLKHMGEQGVNILKRQSSEIDKYAYEIARYVLTQ